MPLKTRDRVGTELADGRYRITARIAEGAMGQVYRAEDRHLEAEVVVKFPIAPEGSPDLEGFLWRFRLESRSLVRLSHPHVVTVIDAGEDGGLPYLVMPYLDGGSLKDRLTPGPDGEPRPMAPGLLHGWLADLARAIDFLHGQGHLHRDVKPANILFDRHGNVFLADFGVIKPPGAAEEARRGRSSSTALGYLLGTPNYVAPELVMAQPSDGRADQYALALSIHESLIGWNVMEGPTPSATMVNQTRLEPPAPEDLVRDVPRRLSDAVLKGLAKEPGERFESCSALAAEALADVPRPVPGRPLPEPVTLAAASEGTPGRVPCPACGGLLPVTGDHAGRRITCTRCRATAVVQLAAGAVRLRLMMPPPAPDPTPEADARPPETPAVRGPEAPGPGGGGRLAGRRAMIGAGLAFLAAAGVGLAVPRFLGVDDRRPGGPAKSGGGRSATGPPPEDGKAGDEPDPESEPEPPAPSPVEINIAHGTEKRRWLEAAVEEFRRTPEGRGIAIHLIGRGSIQGAVDILDGPGPRPIHVWAPAGGVYREVFEHEWRVRHGGRGPILAAENLALSPMVFVFWKDRYDAFLKEYDRVDFRTLARAMHEPGGWGTIAGRPEWGLFRFAHADPARSNSGLVALALMAHEFAGNGRGLTLLNITKPEIQAAFQQFERGVTRHGPALTESTGTLMEEMVLRGPSEYDGLLLYENLAIDFMETAGRNWGEELRVAYPDPNLWNEHPYCILDVPWSDRGHRDAAAAFLRFLRSEPAQRLALRHGFRPGNPEVAAREPEGPIARMARYGIRPDVPRTTDPPRADVVNDLLAAYRRAEP